MKLYTLKTAIILLITMLFFASCSGQAEEAAHGPNEEISAPNTNIAGTPPKMSILATQELIPGIFAVESGKSNFFLVKSGESYIAIDAGELNSKKAKNRLDRLGISSDDIAVVLLTHTDGDHTGAINLFGEATVYWGALSSETWETLTDGEAIEVLGMLVQCIYTRGHRKDSVCYLIDGKYLFSGDTLSLRGNHIKLFISDYNDSDEVQEEDIIGLSNIAGIEYIFTAHHGYTDNPVFPQI